MEENAVQNDRFYEEKKEMLEFAPEPIHMRESLRNGAFTVGNTYPIVERTGEKGFSFMAGALYGGSYKFKTIDDKGVEVWTDEKYFIPAERTLTFEETEDFSDWAEELNPDIRKMAEEQGVERWDIDSDCISTKESKYPIKEVVTLAGLSEEDEDEYEDEPCTYAGRDNWKSEPFWKTTCKHKMKREKFDINEGVVKDDGNDMMFDADKCLAAMSKVFGTSEVVDPDDIINSIRELIYGHLLTWQDGYLAIDDAKTKIAYADVQKAYSGLKVLTTAKVAEKTVSRLVARKLNKLF